MINLYIEEAIQETVVASEGISAEYGRFSGRRRQHHHEIGHKSVLGARFARHSTTTTGDRSVVGNGNFAPLASGQTTPAMQPGHWDRRHADPRSAMLRGRRESVEGAFPPPRLVFGGPIVKDRLTFFTAGRFQNQESARNTALPVNYAVHVRRSTPAVRTQADRVAHERITASRGRTRRRPSRRSNQTFSAGRSMDLASLYTRTLPLDGYQVSYNGILSNQFFVGGPTVDPTLHLDRHRSGDNQSRIAGTLLLDQGRGGLRYWSPTFCGVCDRAKSGTTTTVT